MAVYSHRMMTLLAESIERISIDYFSRMPLLLTPDEFVSAFIQPDHVARLKDVEELVGFVGRTGSKSRLAANYKNEAMGLLSVSIEFAHEPPIMLPNYINHGRQAACPEGLDDRLEAWASERLRLGYAFGDARDALRELNDMCPDARTMAILLPCFPYIMSNISDAEDAATTKRAQQLAHNKSVGQMPKLPRRVKDRLQEVSTIVGSHSLMKDSVPPTMGRGYAKITRVPYGDVPRRTNIFDRDADGSPNEVHRKASFL